ncbi:hypothetical protein GXW83_14035 [Streptacidiphilus sp. PB12-B1b]|uniref:hypothetical protein n=1 Tax=Streptacidiphilus sp. PB12-B1b TaxID=2705012 RepID=UPI0015F87F1E|nr:hypothetical protein [Streptacidiphilus sp. PB12-B1b]QMU76694.1 hypothetical protein GXW83_14035 [Streptacidiphilus sp. PB12-B1b]
MQLSVLTVLLAVIGTVLALGLAAVLRADPSDIPAVLDSLTHLVRAFAAAR